MKDANGLYKVDGTQLYLNPTDNKVYEEDTYTTEYTGDRYDVDENIYTGVTNKRDGVIPTGVLMSIAGGAVLIAAAGTGIVVLNRKRREDEE